MAWFEDGNTRIHYEEEGAGDAVLVIPGWSMSIEDMAPVRQVLASQYRVIAADAPGSGKSGPQPRAYAPSFYHDDARTFIDLLHELKADPAHVVGFSDGGEYALVMAEIAPAAVRSIAAWGAVGQIAAPREMLEAFSHVVDSPMPPFQDFSNYLKDAYGEGNARKMVQSWSTALGAIIDAGGDIALKRAGEIACPALLITGEQDVLAPPQLVSELAGAMQNAEFVEAKDAGHAIHHERPEWLAGTIAGWLAKH
jgi:valacyclovir hydrolase